MKCPFCGTLDNRVIDSRLSQGGEVTRRRRECDACGRRYTTYERVEQVLRNWPKLRLCVPHFGADEFAGYAALLERHDNLWLDSTMMLADYFPQAPPRTLLERQPQRVLYGTDFPNLPYAWDRELRLLRDYALSPETLEWICGRTARELFAIT